MSVNEEILNNMIRHKIQIERLSSSITDRVFKSIRDKISKSIKIPDNISEMSERQVLMIKGQVEAKIKEIIVIEYPSFEDELRNYALYEKKYIHNSTSRVVPAAITLKAVELSNDQVIDRMKLKSDSLIAKNVFEKISDRASRGYGNAIMEGYRNGEGSKEIARKLFNVDRNWGGIQRTPTELKKLKNEIRTLSRTACNSINSEVNKEFFEKNIDLVDGYLFVSTLDSRTSTTCGSLDGRRFEKGAEPNLPLHYNCRSILLPILKGSDDLDIGARKSMDGKVPKTENYETWLKKQDREFIEEVLGEKKAELFINEKIPLERFIDNNTGKDLTLRQIAVREGIDFNDLS